MTTINNIEISKLNYVEGQFIPSKDFSDYIDEDTQFQSVEGYLYFNTEDEICFDINFEQNISGYITGCPGDNWTPSSYSAVIEDHNFNIISLEIDGKEVELTTEIENILNSMVSEKIYGTK